MSDSIFIGLGGMCLAKWWAVNLKGLRIKLGLPCVPFESPKPVDELQAMWKFCIQLMPSIKQNFTEWFNITDNALMWLNAEKMRWAFKYKGENVNL